MVYFKNDGVYITADGLFSLEKTFLCGQCFRFEKKDSGFSGIAFGRQLSLFEKDGFVILRGVGEREYDEIWKNYFDLERDYSEVNKLLCRDKVMARAVGSSKGLRVLRQDKWETLCSFIISQNNNIPRIKSIISTLCRNFGNDIGGAFSFPDVSVIAGVGEEELKVIRAGFREKYILDAARRINSGEIDLDAAEKMEYPEAREYLTRLKGVGGKVADCALLFGYGFLEAFPKDVWIKKAVEKYYGDNFDESIFSPYGGIAQQYLYYYERLIAKNGKTG
ncbi:MAG: DNA glycosylase [Eubacteriales bacterium]